MGAPCGWALAWDIQADECFPDDIDNFEEVIALLHGGDFGAHAFEGLLDDLLAAQAIQLLNELLIGFGCILQDLSPSTSFSS
jgi:hypothetical protein